MWMVKTVRKADVARFLQEGWEPLGASMVQGHTFEGAPVVREFWHLRQWKEVAEDVPRLNPLDNVGGAPDAK